MKLTVIDAMEKAYEACITRTLKGGLLSIACKRGLWAVSGGDTKRVEAEARHYWIQYFRDGEYSRP